MDSKGTILDARKLFMEKRMSMVAHDIKLVYLSLLNTPAKAEYLSENIDVFLQLCKKVDALYTIYFFRNYNFRGRALAHKRKFEANKYSADIKKLQTECLLIPFAYVYKNLIDDFPVLENFISNLPHNDP